MRITVYQRADSFRVVADVHKIHATASRDTVHVYPNAKLAYAAEQDVSIRAAILRIDPTAGDGHSGSLPPLKLVKIPSASIAADRVHISPSMDYGYWHRADGSEGGGLWFKGKTLTDYDGAFELPRVICDQIVSLGYEVGPEFYPL